MEKQTNGIKTIAGAIVVAGLLIAGAIFVSSTKADTEQSANTSPNSFLLKIREDDHVLGNAKAPLTIIEYSDFRCGYCRLFETTLKSILAKYPNDVKLVYRHYPQLSEAFPSAVASECVASLKDEDAFWSFSGGLFANQDLLGEDLYVSLAEKEGITKDSLLECISSGLFDARVKSDLADSQILGARGTPYSILVLPNGQSIPFSGALPQETIETLIERALVSSN
jgi:protein-disulfide isomerase